MENYKNSSFNNNIRTTNQTLGHFPDNISEFHLINSIDMSVRQLNDNASAKEVQDNQYSHPGFVQEGDQRNSFYVNQNITEDKQLIGQGEQGALDNNKQENITSNKESCCPVESAKIEKKESQILADNNSHMDQDDSNSEDQNKENRPANKNHQYSNSITSGEQIERDLSFLEKLRKFMFGPTKRLEKVRIYFGQNAQQDRIYKLKNNMVRTTKYNLITWFPKSLLLQFSKAANVYFLIITILTAMPFSPKMPQTQFLTFSGVLFFTMLKEAYEDYQRYKLDKEVNFKGALSFDYGSMTFIEKKWCEINPGDLLKVQKDEAFPCDIIMTACSSKNGIAFVDTMNLDGETNLKEKLMIKEFSQISEYNLFNLKGMIDLDSPNEFIEAFEAAICTPDINHNKPFSIEIHQLLLRGSVLKNTNWIMGIVVYCGHDTKVYKNARKPPSKMSHVLRKMNKILYSVFVLQATICIILAVASIVWEKNNKKIHFYLGDSSEPGAYDYIQRIFVYLVAYSQLIPISLYVTLEVLKLLQGYLIVHDKALFYDVVGKPAQVKTSDLIEELGQVEFIFSDKTGTLTCNEMELKKIFIGGKVFGDGHHKNPTSKYHINNDPGAYKILKESPKTVMATDLDRFFRLISICHTVVPDSDERKNGILKYQAASPDELALVEGASRMGYKFISRSSNKVEIEILDQAREEWLTLVIFPFDSSRKRMSVIVRNPVSNEIWLMTKGADSIMLPLLRNSDREIECVLEQLTKFAVEGLRTLVMAQKCISEDVYNTFMKEYDNIKISVDKKKDVKLSSLFETLENNLDLVGTSAIEDKLQDGVPDTIFKMMEADIRVWVLTGDKQETAIEIGKSCKLIQTDMEVIILSSKTKDEFKRKLMKNVAQYNIDLDKEIPPLYLVKTQSKKKICIVIDGTTLTWAFKMEPYIRLYFFRLALLANSCICCRVSPKQKADVVKLAKENGKWITLAIGDGANDVSMIMEAHIGVGIMGKEGTQAARSADFVICQFRFLQKLLLVHGRWGYRRISWFICYYFYKNFSMVFCEIYFAFFNGLSGQLFFADWLPMLFNALWTSWPCMANFCVDKDANVEYSLRYPKLYKAGTTNYYFNFRNFWIWVCSAIWHGTVCFWIPVFGFLGSNDSTGQIQNHWLVSTMSFCVMMHTITFKLFLETSYWNRYSFYLGIISLVFFYVTLFLLCLDFLAKLLQPNINGVLIHILEIPKAWVVLIFIPGMALIPDFISFFKRKYVSPSPADAIMRLQKEKKFL